MAELELTVLMPCLNEAETLAVCIGKARGYLERAGVSGEVLIADNGSTDGSQAIAEAAGARVVAVATRGYGAALSTVQSCLRNKCNSLFTDAKGLGKLRAGCLFYADWMMAADNPKMIYKEVKCPDDLVNRSALTQGGISDKMCGG